MILYTDRRQGSPTYLRVRQRGRRSKALPRPNSNQTTNPLALVRAPNSASDSFDDCYRTNALPLGMLDSAFEATFLTLVIALAIAVVVLVLSRWWR